MLGWLVLVVGGREPVDLVGVWVDDEELVDVVGGVEGELLPGLVAWGEDLDHETRGGQPGADRRWVKQSAVGHAEISLAVSEVELRDRRGESCGTCRLAKDLRQLLSYPSVADVRRWHHVQHPFPHLVFAVEPKALAPLQQCCQLRRWRVWKERPHTGQGSAGCDGRCTHAPSIRAAWDGLRERSRVRRRAARVIDEGQLAGDLPQRGRGRVARRDCQLDARRPADPDLGVIPGDAAFDLGAVVSRLLVEHVRRLRERTEAMGEADRYIQDAHRLVVELIRLPLAVGGRATTQVDEHVDDRADAAAHELRDAIADMEVHAPHDAPARPRVVVLDELLALRDSRLAMPLATVGLAEEAPAVRVDVRLDEDRAGEAGGESAHRVGRVQGSGLTSEVAEGSGLSFGGLCLYRPMDAQEWRAAQRDLRRRLRSLRGSDEGEPVAPVSGPSPWVSVIVVCWNSGGVLRRCLDQLLAQDYPSYEVIVVDDGSEDDTLEVAQSAAVRHRQLKIVASGRNRGCPHARNLGLRHATGEIVAFIDADGYAAPDWLSQIVQAFAADERIGGVASTVFFAANPQVINGAGGTVNCQGWAADLSMNEPYERAQIASEALYPMGCGMAVRRAALERVGPFDDRMLNYYDDVDYGIRLWRAGYRVVVAPEAWIDHGFGGAGSGDQARKQLLCEQHRMRVVLKHAPSGTLARWAAHELRELWRASAARRARKLKAGAWNMAHLASLLAIRWRLRNAAPVPERLVDVSWGDGFPAGVPPILRPRPEDARSAIEIADERSEYQLLYGWYTAEHVAGRSYRWTAPHAAVLIRLRAPARMLRLDYAHAPVDNGGVDLCIRRLGSPEPLDPVWGTRLPWQHAERLVENHPLALEAGDYEVVFSAREAWLELPQKVRLLGIALASMSFEESYDIPPGGLDIRGAGRARRLAGPQ